MQAQYYDNLICKKVHESLQKQRENKVQLTSFNQKNQTKEQTREWDLNRKDILKIEPPLGSIESTLRPSSLQKFEGEDSTAFERRDLQLKQQRNWCEMQKAEKESKKQQEIKENIDHAQLLLKQQSVQAKAEERLHDSRKQLQLEIVVANKTLAAEKREREQAMKALEEKLNVAEIDAMQSSPFVNEDRIVGVSSTQPWRVRTDHWKGMTDGDKAQIRDYQHEQRIEREKLKENAQAWDNYYAQNSEMCRRYVTAAAHQHEDVQAQQRKENADFLKQQMDEKTRRDKRNKEEIYNSYPTEDFFNQFGRSHR